MTYVIKQVVQRELTADEFRDLALTRPDKRPAYAIGDMVSFQKRDGKTAYGVITSIGWEGGYDTHYTYGVKWADLVEEERFTGPFELSLARFAESQIMLEERIKFDD